jgi:hypothetical protein
LLVALGGWRRRGRGWRVLDVIGMEQDGIGMVFRMDGIDKGGR